MSIRGSDTIGLAVGNSFAEAIVGARDSGDWSTHRWFLGRKSFADGLREFLLASKENLAASGQIHLSSFQSAHPTGSQRARAARSSGNVAFVVTTGFENWLSLNQPLQSSHLALRPKREILGVGSEHIFGVGERTRHDGTIEKPVPLDELEFLKAKFELLKIKTVAVGFLHSSANPENETRTESYFREQGFEVVSSHRFASHGNELQRWKRTIDFAQTSTDRADNEASVKTILEEVLPESNWQISRSSDDVSSLLAQNSPRGRLHLHFGLEEFMMIDGVDVRRMATQPTQSIVTSPWLFPACSGAERGYEPGPMAFGKSQFPTLLDILYLRDHLTPIDGFTSLLSDRARPRILEALFTLGKAMPTEPGSSPLDATEIAEDIETSIIEKIATDPAMYSNSNTTTVWLSGPLAHTFTPLLARRRPDLKFETPKGFDWAAARVTVDALMANDGKSAATKGIGTKSTEARK